MQMQVNHFSHFLLTQLLLSKMARNGRVINHSSIAAFLAFKYTDFNSNEFYDPFVAYARSKLYNILFTLALNSKLREMGKEVNENLNYYYYKQYLTFIID